MVRPALTLLLIFIDESSFPSELAFLAGRQKTSNTRTGTADEEIIDPTWCDRP